MISKQFAFRNCSFGLIVALVLCSSASAAKRTISKLVTKDPKPGYEAVELFDAMEKGDVAVDFIGINPTKANVILKNKTKKPLSIKLPEVFTGVPVLAQFGGGGMGMGGGMGGGGGGQGMGGGMMGGGMGGGMFNIAAEKVGKLSVNTVCLDHGKKDPNPKMKYKLIPVESYVKDPRVVEVLKMVARGEVTQNTAQGATWHLRSGLSWEELARKDRVRLKRVNYVEKWFTNGELSFAQRIVSVATVRAKDAPTQSPGEQSPGEELQKADSISQQ